MNAHASRGWGCAGAKASLMFLLGAVLAGCATEPTAPAARTAPERRAGSDMPSIQRVAPAILRQELFASTAPVRLVVRAAVPGEVDSETYESMRRGLGWGAVIGVVSITEAVVLPFSMFSGGALLGGVFVTIGAALIMSAEREVQERIVRAVGETNLEARIRVAFRGRLDVAPPDADDVPTLEIVTLTYGVVENKASRQFCVFADMQVMLHVDGVERYRDRLLILPELRSTDTPAPDCRLRDTLAEKEGEVIRAALAGYAAALPAILARRLPGLPWKK